MTDFNPLAGAILGSSQAQHQASVQSSRRVRTRQILAKNTASAQDQFEHQVESSEELAAIQDQPHQDSQRQPKAPPHPHPNDDAEESHIDLQA
jgi:hypothetical protein